MSKVLKNYHYFGVIKRDEFHGEVYEEIRRTFDLMPPVKLVRWGDLFEKYGVHKDTDNSARRIRTILRYIDKPNIDAEDISNLEPWQSDLYHSCKLQWMIHDVKEHGLEYPPQGQLSRVGNLDKFDYFVHPDTGRMGVMQHLHLYDTKVLVWDRYGTIDEPRMKFEEWRDFLFQNHRNEVTEISVLYNYDMIEGHQIIHYRPMYTDNHLNVKERYANKPLTIYVGYDSRHGNLSDVCEKSIKEAIESKAHKNWLEDQRRLSDGNEQLVVVKKLDVSKIPEYTRPYADQSTEFTYSRFLIPYLENFEGVSMFVDDDYIFKSDFLPILFDLKRDDAVACIKHDYQNKGYTQKLGGEKDVWYDKKLWSSLMIFNNAHPDCKKLTPEYVNSASGKDLHRFERTANVGEIINKNIYTEGYSDESEFDDAFAIHFTRGGPWVSNNEHDVKHLEVYEFFKSKFEKEI